MQLAQLLLVHRRRRLGQQALGALGLGEGDHVADRLGAGHHRHDPVETEGQATVRRRAIAQRIEQEAELGLGLLGIDGQRPEDLALHLLAVDAHRATADLPAIERQVISLGDAGTRIGFQQVLVAVLGRGERMVQRHPALRVLVVLEHRKIQHPQRLPAGLEQAVGLTEFGMTDLQAQRADGIVDDLGLVGPEEDQIAVLGTGTREDGGQRLVVQVLDDRRLQAVTAGLDIVDLDPGQPLRAVDADELGVGVDLAAADAGALRHAQCHHAAALGIGRAGKHLEVDRLHHVGQLGELQLDAQVGLVRTIAVHGVGKAHGREGIGQVDVQHLLEDGADHRLEDAPDLLLVQERGLAVDLGEFGLAVGTQVLVPEALDDLVIAIEAGHHQQLLEQLRRLRQRKELAIVHPRRHQVIACAFGRRAGQHRRLDIDEAEVVQITAHRHRHAVAQHQVLLHRRATQVQHPVGQADVLGQVLVIELEGRRHRRIQHLQFVAQHLDLAALDRVVAGARGTATHLAGDADAVLVAQALGRGEGLGPIGIADHLGQALAVAQIDEDHAPVVPTPVDPPQQGHFLIEMGLGHITDITATFH